MKDKVNLNEYLNKLASGELSTDEKKRLLDYISSGFRDNDLSRLMQQHWEQIPKQRFEKSDLYMQQLRNKIWAKISGSEEKPKWVSDWKSYLTKIAALLFIPLLISSVYLFWLLGQLPDEQAVMQQVYASPGSRVHFTLSDKSEVWLNSGSMLEYPANFNNQKQRRVKLQGQGYFKVSHDAGHPFLVETSELNIRVVGTSFDVSTYANDPFIRSTLEEGSIVLTDLQGKEVIHLNPGQKASFNRTTREFVIEKVNTQLITSWKDGRLNFRNTPLDEVVNQLERWFNCSIHVSPDLLGANILYTATIQDETLGEVLEMIEISTSVKINVKNREVTIENKN